MGWFTVAILKHMVAVAKRRPIMPTNIGTAQRSQRAEDSNRAESGIATLWLVFYAVALGVAISSPLISRAIEFTALTRDY